MSKLKRKANTKIKLHSTFKSDTIKFSWQYLTTNKTHNFERFKGEWRQELSARQELSDLVRDLCSSTWTQALLRRKNEKHGAETLSMDDLRFAANGYQFSNDQKVIVFGLGSNSSYRLLGIKGDESNVLYVIGYDFDFSAYNHGS